MRNATKFLTVSCLLVSSGLFVAPTFAETMTETKTTITTPAPDANANATLPTGIDAKALNDDKALEKVFAAVTDDALTKKDFSGVVGYLSDQDKARVKKSTDKSLNNMDGNKNKSLNDIIASMGGAWKAKYNQDFKPDYKAVFNSSNLQLATGVVNNPDNLVGKWPVAVTANASTAGSMTAADAENAKAHAFGGNVNLEQGREVAIAHLNAGNGFSGITASLIHEHVSGWRFDIPNTIDADRLYNNLVTNLSYLNNNRDAWSGDVNQAYGQVANAVVAALYDIDISQAANRNPNAQ